MAEPTQDELRQFVDHEVYYCVSGLISRLTELEPDEWFDLFRREPDDDDWIEAASWSNAEIIKTPLGWSHDPDGERFDTEGEAARDFCEENGNEPEPAEVYEHWIVSDWLARKLKAHGEVINDDVYGLTIWGRCTTGQAILLDGIIADIYKELHCKAA